MVTVKRSVRVSGALALGLGALVASEAQADRSDPAGLASAPQQSEHVVVRTDGDRIYVSERGGAFRELALADTPETLELRRLLNQAGHQAMTVPVGSFVVANGGGNVGGAKPAATSKKGKAKKKRASHAHG